MVLEWLNNDFFMVNGKPPCYNVNKIERFVLVDDSYYEFGDVFPIHVCRLNIFTKELSPIATFDKRDKAEAELVEFMKNRPENKKEETPVENTKNILID